MELTSVAFFAFVLLFLLTFYSAPRKYQLPVLLVSSYVFYVTWSPQFAAILFAMTIANFLLARLINRRRDTAKTVFWIGVAFNLLVLLTFKYSDFFVSQFETTLNSLGVQTETVALQFLLPIGMSFYILHAISYLADVHQNLIPDASFISFSLYLAYFPKLLSGPIARVREFFEDLSVEKIVDANAISRGVMLIVLGLFRKLVIADPLRQMIAPEFFFAPENYSATQLLSWFFAFSFSAYNDFSGYTDIARGVSLLFGIELPRNFVFPYFVTSVGEFWTHWHRSFTMWLRDYIYLPLSRWFLRNQFGGMMSLALIIPPIAATLTSGAWHGINSGMLSWGFAMGLLLAAERLVGWSQRAPRLKGFGRAIAAITVFSVVTTVNLLIVMEPPTLASFLSHLFGVPVLAHLGKRIFLLVAVSLVLDALQYRAKDEFVFVKWPAPQQAAAYAVALIAIFLVTRANVGGPFVYQGF